MSQLDYQPQNCKNCGHYSHCGQPLWKENKPYSSEQPNQYKACDSCRCDKCINANNKIISVITDPVVGGSFLSWSIPYLGGQSTYFNTEINRWLPLVANPVTKNKNAHNHWANFFNKLDGMSQIVDILKSTDSQYPHVLYYHPSATQTTNDEVDFLLSNSDKSVVLSMDKNYGLYMSNMSRREGGVPSHFKPSRMLTNDEDIFDDFLNYFFSDSKEVFSNLNNVWDKREFIALNYRMDSKPVTAYLNNVEQDRSYFRLNCFDMYTTFDTSVYKLFEYLELEINNDRYKEWVTVYHTWKKHHYKRLRFMWYVDEIVDDILYNRPRNLIDFDLDLLQEAIIQQKLIKTYNLNLKNWQLERFTNTQQLHSLLEPNIHA